MNGKKARELREDARILNGSARSKLESNQWRPKPVFDFRGIMTGQLERWTDIWGGHRRVYQDLKKERGFRRSGTRELDDREVEKLRGVLKAEQRQREAAQRRRDYKARQRRLKKRRDG